MIPSNELRIGNYVNVTGYGYSNGQQVRMKISKSIKGVRNLTDEESYVYLEDEKIGCLNIRPIPLTEEILLKCGFEKQITEGEVYFAYGDCFELHQFNDYGHFAYTCGDNLKGNFVSIRIDSLHQLQNLYFALTGKELEIQI